MSTGKNAFWLTATKILSLAINMLVVMILSRYRSLEEYGVFSQITLVTTLGSSIFMLGMPGSINYFLNRAENKQEQNKFLSHYFILGTFLSALLALVLFALSPLIVRYFNNELIYTYLFVMMLLPWINIFGSTVDNIFIAYENVMHLMIYRVAYSVCLLMTAIICAWLQVSFLHYMISYVSVQVIFSLYVYIIAQKMAGRFTYKIDLSFVKTIFAFTIPLGLSAVVSTLNIEVDKLLIGGVYDTDTLAIYTNASKELPVNIISLSISTVLMPRIVRMMKNEQKTEAIALWKKSVEISFILLCFFCMILFVFAPQAIKFLYSEKYLPGTDIFRVYALVLLHKVTYFGLVLNAIGKTRKILICSISSLVINVVLNIVLFKMFGIIGPALATLVSVFAMSFLELKMTSKEIDMPVRDIFPFGAVLKIFLTNVVLGALAYAVFTFLNKSFNEWLVCIGIGIVLVIVYAVLMRKYLKEFIQLKNIQIRS